MDITQKNLQLEYGHIKLERLNSVCVWGIKHFTTEDAKHLLATLKKYYNISTDWSGNHYCGLTLNWTYDEQFVDISMPGYVHKQLERYQHKKPDKAQYAPHRWSLPSYGQPPKQIAVTKTVALNKQQAKLVQSIAGAFLYYGRAVDPTILPALTEISSQQCQPTDHTMQTCKMLMDYLHTYPNAIIRYTKSDMVLYVDSDAAYLVLPNARSRVAGHFYLGQRPLRAPAKPPNISTNGPIHTICKGLR